MSKKKNKIKMDIWNKLAAVVLTLFLIGCVSVFMVLINIVNDPDGMVFKEEGLTTLSNSRIFDTNGELVYEFGEEIREDVTYEQIPQTVIDAFLSIEDSRFFDHNGFDLPRFIAAAFNDLKSGDFSQGGSTLTMQMIDNAFTSNQEEKLISENGSISKLEQVKLKIQEIYLSLVAEQTIDKESIFEYYVNRIWFGSGGNTRGIQKAAQYYFNKDVSQLNLSEAAFLAGSINAPATYNPMGNLNDYETDHLKAGQDRRNVTLDLMLNHGYISEEEYNLAINTNLAYSLQYQTGSTSDDPNEAYIAQVIDEVKDLTGQDPSIIPMDIYTALNTDVQNQADQICAGNIIAFPDDLFDVGFSIIDNASGEIIAVGAGRTYHTDAVKVDNSTDRKQPGSSMKPVLAYSSTFDLLGWSTEHVINDQKKDYWHNGSYLNNSDGTFSGNISLAYALGVSKNTCAAEAMEELIAETGYDYWINFLKECGYDSDVAGNFNEQYSIGGSDMWASPIQQASAYTMFANGGARVDAHRVRTVIRRSDGEETQTNAQTHQILSSGAAYMTSYLLYKVVNGGYQNFNNKLADTYPCYGKSGTSDWGDAGLQYGIPESAIRDEWSIGYTSQFTIACWSGYTQSAFMQGYYIPTAYVSNYAMAFDISDYMLDYCQQYGDYHDIPVPDDVTNYSGGYILKQYASKGDSSSGTATNDSDAEEKEEDKKDSEEKEGKDQKDQKEQKDESEQKQSDQEQPDQEQPDSSESQTDPSQTQPDQSGGESESGGEPAVTTEENASTVYSFNRIFNLFSWI